MAGGTRGHNRIARNILAGLHTRLGDGPCEAFGSDMRLRVTATGLYTYPDVMVVCGEAQVEDDNDDTLLEATIVFEVLSDSTEQYDRGDKASHYRHLSTLREFFLISQNQVRVERFVRQGNDWLFTEFSDLSPGVEIDSLDIEIPMREIY